MPATWQHHHVGVFGREPALTMHHIYYAELTCKSCCYWLNCFATCTLDFVSEFSIIHTSIFSHWSSVTCLSVFVLCYAYSWNYISLISEKWTIVILSNIVNIALATIMIIIKVLSLSTSIYYTQTMSHNTCIHALCLHYGQTTAGEHWPLCLIPKEPPLPPLAIVLFHQND